MKNLKLIQQSITNILYLPFLVIIAAYTMNACSCLWGTNVFRADEQTPEVTILNGLALAGSSFVWLAPFILTILFGFAQRMKYSESFRNWMNSR